ncbi:hypothetical protein BY996DRAFT_6918067 [Phakopsora pachyrhizi]|nr:hypothetical protein BY996DRAFT_6918067 [Phakopsora pachyrhizi]
MIFHLSLEFFIKFIVELMFSSFVDIVLFGSNGLSFIFYRSISDEENLMSFLLVRINYRLNVFFCFFVFSLRDKGFIWFNSGLLLIVNLDLFL